MADDAVPKTFTNLGQSVSDIFAGFAAETSASLTALGLRIQAYGTLTDNADAGRGHGNQRCRHQHPGARPAHQGSRRY